MIGLIRCCGARDRQGNVFLSLELRGVNRLGIQVKSRARLCVTEKLLNRFNVLAPANQESRKAMTEIVESEPLTRLQPNAGFNGCGANLLAAIMLALRGFLPFSFKDGNIQSSGFP